MKKIGVDIGTTNITTIIAENENLIEVKTTENDFLFTNNTFEMVQSPQKIWKKVFEQVEYFFKKYHDIEAIGITGQMHGIVYLSKDLEAISDLYTWCDQRANQEYINGQTYAEYMEYRSNIKTPVGYGFTTHFYNMINERLEVYKMVTIHDYIALKLSKAQTVYMHSSNAASFGYYDILQNQFMSDKLTLLGIDLNILPTITTKRLVLGEYKNAKVFIAIGDNQASYLGATKNANALLINIGTGAQISLKTSSFTEVNGVEIRPYIDNDYLLVGASICGGKAFEALAKLFQEISGKSLEDLYKEMTSIPYFEDDLIIKTTFLGTRENANELGAVTNITLNNFKKDNLILAVLKGIVDELYSFYEKMNTKSFEVLISSGNGIRKNALLRTIIAKKFNTTLIMNNIQEEAAYGASLFANIEI